MQPHISTVNPNIPNCIIIIPYNKSSILSVCLFTQYYHIKYLALIFLEAYPSVTVVRLITPSPSAALSFYLMVFYSAQVQ